MYNVWSGLDPLMDPLNNGMSPADLVCKCYVSTLPNVNMSVLMHSRVCMYKQLVLYSFETFNRVRKIDLSLEIGWAFQRYAILAGAALRQTSTSISN